jgi:putative transposase
MAMDTSLTSRRVIRGLDQLIAWRGAPKRIRVDNGLEFIAEKLAVCAKERSIEMRFIEKGKPYQN